MLNVGADEESQATAGAGVELRPRAAEPSFAGLVFVPTDSCRARFIAGAHHLVCARARNCRSTAGGVVHTVVRATSRAEAGH